MENTSGGRKVNIQNDMPPKNKIKNDTSLSQLWGCNLNCVKACS